MKVKRHGCNAIVVNSIPCHEHGCREHLVFTYRKKEFALFKVYSLDVWGNEKEGFDVNDRREIGSVLIPLFLSDRNVVKALKEKNFLKKKIHTSSIYIYSSDDYEMTVYERKTSMPIYQLERQ